MKHYIYALYDPRFPKNIRYIGCTENLKNRIHTHVSGKERATQEWANFLKAENVPMSFKVLEMPDSRIAFHREKYWIDKLMRTNELINRPAPVRAFEFPPSEAMTLRELEKRYIDWVLTECRGNKLEASKMLGIGRQTLYNKLASYGMAEEAPALPID